jgi:hypothetical protein
VDEIVEETIHISSFSERALSQSLGPVDVEIARLRKKATPVPPRPVTPTVDHRPSSDAPPIPSSVPSTSFWDSAKARSLFQPRPEESVPVCLQRRIDLLNGVYNNWSRLQEVLDDGEATESELSSHQRQRLLHKCLFLGHAYELALFRMNKGSNWANICEEATQDLNKIGIRTYTSSRVVQDMNRDFRKLELFQNPRRASKGIQDVALFAVFPEAHNMLLSWGKKNLETLNSETARKYLLEVVIPFCHEQCNEELTMLGNPSFNLEQFMKFVNLKTLTVVTTWRWLRLLGFTYCENKKCYYTDGHE